ncbi:hypothetical protein [Asanoa iriomotensis]|uniref:Uncharacterized protein n=1 Tax=Asanoa iriomotensis TaxID=234613 RepID=A0ABQ4BWG2_9ACTN|nr:hypothetical protein [Asanoa iriomotensis]GIF54867.1 hypothetical protein Air01nite_09620 [Asanoa iriomotensis]
MRAGDRWWAARCARAGTQITIVARDWRPAVTAVRADSDVEPLLAGLAGRRPPRPALPAATGPHDIPAEPHRPLADAVLRNTREQASWLAGGGPVPRLPDSWGALWTAAVRRQMELADETESQAQRAVSSFTSQLSSLEHEAAWFRDDDELREQAIAETLLFATGLRTNVPSRPAQLAWLRRTGAATPPTNLTTAAADQTGWLAAWATWADSLRER